MIERSYRKRPQKKADFFWNPYGIGYSTGHWLYVERYKIKHYVEVSETDQRTSWEHRYLRVFRRDSPEDMKLLLQELPDRIIERLNQKYSLFPEEGSEPEDEEPPKSS